MTEDARQRVALLLTERRWRQSDLVRASGIDKNTVSDFLSGKRKASPGTLQRIETALGLTPGTLAGHGEERVPAGVASELSDADLLAELTYRLERHRREVDELRRENEELRSKAEPAPPTMAEAKRRRLLADAMPVEEAAYEGDRD